MFLLKSPGSVPLMEKSFSKFRVSLLCALPGATRMFENVFAVIPHAWFYFSSPCYLMSPFPLLYPKIPVKGANQNIPSYPELKCSDTGTWLY